MIVNFKIFESNKMGEKNFCDQIGNYVNYIVQFNNEKVKADNKPIKILTEDDYKERLNLPNSKLSEEDWLKNAAKYDKAKLAFDFVKETRAFEIELYWKRATYFWAFTASIFAAYYFVREKKLVNIEFLVICIGFIVSCAWHLTNIGSKTWQRHWEKHLDLFENHFMGPLYKTVNSNLTYSVTKINEIISFVFTLVWLGLGAEYMAAHLCLPINKYCGNLLEYKFILTLFVTICAWLAMNFGHGRGRFKRQNIEMYIRDYDFK